MHPLAKLRASSPGLGVAKLPPALGAGARGRQDSGRLGRRPLAGAVRIEVRATPPIRTRRVPGSVQKAL